MFKDINFHSKAIVDVRWSYDGLYLASSSHDRTVRVSQLDSSGSLKSLQVIPTTPPRSGVVWNPAESSRFLISGEDKFVDLWDVRASKATIKLTTLGNNLYTAWSPNGKYIAVVNRSNNVIVYDSSVGRQIRKVKFGYEINELQWTLNSDHLLVAGGGNDLGTIDILGFKNDDLILVDTITGHTASGIRLKLDADFRRLAMSSGDNNVTLWDLEDLVCHHCVPFETTVRSLGFSGDGQYVAMAPDSQAILTVCNSETAEVVNKIDCRYPLTSFAWHPTQQSLIAVAPDDRSSAPQFLRLLKLPPL